MPPVTVMPPVPTFTVETAVVFDPKPKLPVPVEETVRVVISTVCDVPLPPEIPLTFMVPVAPVALTVKVPMYAGKLLIGICPVPLVPQLLPEKLTFTRSELDVPLAPLKAASAR